MSNPNPSKDTRFKDGVSGNPGGKLKGERSIKRWIRSYLVKNPDEFEKVAKSYIDDERHRELLWKMLEGAPHTSSDILHTIPQNIIDLFYDEQAKGGGEEDTVEE